MKLRLLLTVVVLFVLATAATADGLGTFMDQPAPTVQLANLSPTVSAEVPAAALTEADPIGDFWAAHRVRWAAFKGVDDLASLGVGTSIELWAISAASSAWLDLAPYYDRPADRIGGLIGLSTEIDGIPILSMLLAPVRKLTNDTLSRAGVGLWNWNFIAYVTVDF